LLGCDFLQIVIWMLVLSYSLRQWWFRWWLSSRCSSNWFRAGRFYLSRNGLDTKAHVSRATSFVPWRWMRMWKAIRRTRRIW
jgi:hypothetical protein